MRLRRHVHTFFAFVNIKTTSAGLKPRWLVSTTSASRVVCGTCLRISFVAPCPRSAWAVRPPWHRARQGCLSSPFQRACRQFGRHFFVRPFLVSASSTLTRAVTSASSMRTAWSFWLSRRLAVEWPSMLCTRGVFVGGFLSVSVPPNQPPCSLVLSATAMTAVCILEAFPCL